MRFCVLGSGSGGNCTVVSSGRTHVLIDCGLSAKRVEAGLALMGVSPDGLSGIFISHEHSDHVQGLKVFLKRWRAPVFAKPATWAAMSGTLPDPIPEMVPLTGPQVVGDIQVDPFPIPHDAADPCGFVVDSGSRRLAHLTDLGCLTDAVRHRLQGAHALVVESNHDEEMLKIGPYTWELKQRVLGRLGHLSNRSLAGYLERDFDGVASTVVLAHLSRQNNHPEIALLSAAQSLDRRRAPDGGRPLLVLAAQDRPTPVLDVDSRRQET